MKNTLFLLLFLASTYSIIAQETTTATTEKVWRINFINPGIELEIPTSNSTTFSAELGVGYGGSYPDLDTSIGTGFVYVIAPFLDLQEKWLYNLNKRLRKDRTISHNSGNFLSLRMLTRGPSLKDNISRTSAYDFAIGPTWGIQRNYGRFHLLFDTGFIYYFDTKGNGNVFPIMFQLNLGVDL